MTQPASHTALGLARAASGRALADTVRRSGLTWSSLLMFVSDTDDRPLPNGAEVTLTERPDRIGVVAAGRVLLRLLPEQVAAGRLLARWTAEDGRAHTCPLDRLPTQHAGSSGDTARTVAARCTVHAAGSAATGAAAL